MNTKILDEILDRTADVRVSFNGIKSHLRFLLVFFSRFEPSIQCDKRPEPKTLQTKITFSFSLTFFRKNMYIYLVGGFTDLFPFASPPVAEELLVIGAVIRHG